MLSLVPHIAPNAYTVVDAYKLSPTFQTFAFFVLNRRKALLFSEGVYFFQIFEHQIGSCGSSNGWGATL